MTSSAMIVTLPTSDPSSEVHFFDAASVESYCQKRRIAFQNDAAAIDLAKEDLLRRQQQIVLQGLLKLTKDVKKLTVKEFDESYGCDVIDMIKKMMLEGEVIGSNGKKRVRQIPSGGSSGSDGTGVTTKAGLSLKTPAPRFGMGVPATRTARKGEKIIAYSVNGSPVDQFDQGELVVTAKKRRPNQTVVALPVTIGIGAGNGQCIDLADPNARKKLGEDEKKQAMEQILAMQEQMKNLMAEW